MKYYQLIFIVIILIAILIMAIIITGFFKKRVPKLKSDYSLKYKQTKIENNYELNNGLGFDFGREYFACDTSGSGPRGNSCDRKKTSIGIKFHTFKMNNNYEHTNSLDEVVLNDYCSREYLEKNFINILNNIWLASGLSFYFRELIIEDEVENLVHYYNYTTNENTIFPDCGDVEYYLKNPFNMNAPIGTAQSLSDLLSEAPSFTTSSSIPNARIHDIMDNISADNTKKLMAQNDIEILKEILSKDNFFQADINSKKIVRNIMFRMIDETNYLDDNDFHICLLPFIQDDIAFVLEGRSNGNSRGRPILVISMFYKDCNKIYKVIENISSDKTCGLWLDKLLGNYQQLRSLEEDYNSIAKIDLVSNNSNGGDCDAKTLDPSHTLNTLLDRYRSDEHNLMDDMKEHHQQYDIEELNQRILLNTRKLQDIYEYDYNNDPRLIETRKFKNRRGPITIVETNGVKVEQREEIIGYQERRRRAIEKINKDLEDEKDEINRQISADRNIINIFNEHAQTLQVPLTTKRGQIHDLINPHLGTNNLKKLKKLKEVMERLRVEINYPLEMAKKVKRVLGINLLILNLFNMSISVEDPNLKLKEFSDEPICKILESNIKEGGLVITPTDRDDLQSNRGDLDYKYMSPNNQMCINSGCSSVYGRYFLCGPPENSNNFHKGHEINKCDILEQNMNTICTESLKFETSRDNKLDINAQYYIVFQLLKRINLPLNHADNIQVSPNAQTELEDFFKELKFKCGNCENELDNYRINSDYLKRGEPQMSQKTLFTQEGAIDNYKWIATYIFNNTIDQSKFNFIIDHLNDLHTNPNSVYNGGIMNNDIVNKLMPTNKVYGIGDSEGCNDKHSTSITNNIGLEELILRRQRCHNNNNAYLNSFKSSFI